MSKQGNLEFGVPESETTEVDKYKFEPIQGYPMLNWRGKRPFTTTQFYPAQLKESHGEEIDGWRNKIYWGDNLQVMSHLLRDFRGKIDLIYIDPPFDSKAVYKKQIKTRGKKLSNDNSSFEEKQYADIWTNDEYLQFIYERIVLCRELLKDNGTIFVHCDWHKSHYLRIILEEIFGQQSFLNEITWKRKQATSYASKKLGIANDTIFWVSKSNQFTFNPIYSLDDDNTKKYIKERYRYRTDDGRVFKLGDIGNPEYRPNLIYDYKGCSPPANGWAVSKARMIKMDNEGRLQFPKKEGGRLMRRQFLDEYKGQLIQNIWLDIPIVNSQAIERQGYPTQKPEALLERILTIASNPGDIVFDCFMGSGTTKIAAMKLGRRFIGADINLGAIQISTKRSIKKSCELQPKQLSIVDDKNDILYTGFEVYNVNHYDIFRNPVEAKELLIEALEIQPLEKSSLYDGEKDGRMVKIMPVNRIATRADLNELINGFDYKVFERRQNDKPNQPVEKLLLVCMGHEADLKATLEKEVLPLKLDIKVVDILRDKANLEFKRDSEAKIEIKGDKLLIKQFYPMNLLQKLSLQKESVDDWRELVESVMIDWNYDGAVLEPAEVDLPGKKELVKGEYTIPEDAGTIMVKITDLLSESLEQETNHG